MPNLQDSESALELATVQLFQSLGYSQANLLHETFGETGSHGRLASSEVVFRRRLRGALQSLNEDVPAKALNLAEEELCRDRSAMHPVVANQEVYTFLKDGVGISWRDDDDEACFAKVRVIDWENPLNNDYFIAQLIRHQYPHSKKLKVESTLKQLADTGVIEDRHRIAWRNVRHRATHAEQLRIRTDNAELQEVAPPSSVSISG